jgi:hypothetical protein
MSFYWRGSRRTIWFALAGVILAGAAAVFLRPPSIQQLADRIQADVEKIRGLDFKRPVPVHRISADEWRSFVDEELGKLPRIEDYWAMVRMLGLYQGPDLGPREKYFGDLYSLASGAYDARRDRFVLIADMDEWQRAVVLAHELHHALQDQHFDLEKYVLDIAHRPRANTDELLARQAVVEGEATYIDAIYQAQVAGFAAPTRAELGDFIANRADWDPVQWEQLLEDPQTSANVRAQLQAALETRKRLPPFVFELAASPYVDGMTFIHAVQERGWEEVSRLYGEYPPVSTEQIIHPEKWFAREQPLDIRWPDFETDPRFDGWQLLHDDVLGERQWQVAFRVQGLTSDALPAAAGWNGDRYAFLRNRNDGAFLMLMFTAWDSPEDAAEFSNAYARLLASKYRDGPAPARMRVQGNTVQIVEGAGVQSLEGFLDVVPAVH